MTLPTRDETTRSFFVFARDTNTGVIKRVAVPSDLQVGLIDNPASLDLFGGLSLSTKEFSTTNENMGVIKIGNHDTVAVVSNSVAPPSGRISVYLPVSPRNGQLHFIKDASGTALSTPIDIYPAPGVFIDDETTKSIFDNFGTLVLFGRAIVGVCSSRALDRDLASFSLLMITSQSYQDHPVQLRSKTVTARTLR